MNLKQEKEMLKEREKWKRFNKGDVLGLGF